MEAQIDSTERQDKEGRSSYSTTGIKNSQNERLLASTVRPSGQESPQTLLKNTKTTVNQNPNTVRDLIYYGLLFVTIIIAIIMMN